MREEFGYFYEMTQDEQKRTADSAVLALSDWNLIFTSVNPNDGEVLQCLAAKVQDLLVNNRKFLFQALYRLDVDEEKVNWVMQREQKDRQAIRLAELIFKREMQKAKSRSEHASDPESQQQTQDFAQESAQKSVQESAHQDHRRFPKKN